MLDVGFTTEGTKEIQALFGEKIIQFPKPVSLIKTLVRQGAGKKDYILDFFAGSCTTAQAVLELNREDGGDRHFILVQLPEPTGRPDYPTIAEIGKERVRRAIKQISRADEGKLPLQAHGSPQDLGFKVFKLGQSNYKPWTGVEDKRPEAYAHKMELFTDPLVSGWKPENLIWEVAIKEGYGLNARIELISGIKGHKIYHVIDPDKGQGFRICLDDKLDLKALETLNLSTDDLFICRDAALNDEAAANLALQCRLKTI